MSIRQRLVDFILHPLVRGWMPKRVKFWAFWNDEDIQVLIKPD